jgi:hypothetical protein
MLRDVFRFDIHLMHMAFHRLVGRWSGVHEKKILCFQTVANNFIINQGNRVFLKKLLFHKHLASTLKNKLKSGNSCYHLVHNLLSSSLLSKYIKIKFYRTIILPVVLYGCETGSLTFWEERRLCLRIGC